MDSSTDSVASSSGSSSNQAAGYAGLENFQPQWLLLSESNDWRKRVQVAQRFVQAARVIIYRNRAQARLRQLRALGGKGVFPPDSRDYMCSHQCHNMPPSATTYLLHPCLRTPMQHTVPLQVHPLPLAFLSLLVRPHCTPLLYLVLIACATARMHGSKDGLAAQVLQDLVVEGSVVQRPGVAPQALMLPDRVRPTELPQHCPQAYVQHHEVGKGSYADFSSLQPQSYKVRCTALYLGCCLPSHYPGCCVYNNTAQLSTCAPPTCAARPPCSRPPCCMVTYHGRTVDL